MHWGRSAGVGYGWGDKRNGDARQTILSINQLIRAVSWKTQLASETDGDGELTSYWRYCSRYGIREMVRFSAMISTLEDTICCTAVVAEQSIAD